jgi:dTDP-glucose 4,6-dehydratase
MSKTLVVTGGCGFIGSHFVKRFLRTHAGWNVINLDKLTYAGSRENTRDLESNSRYKFVQGDIADKKLVDSLLSGIDGVVNFAAETHVDRSIDDPDAFLTTNVLGTRALLEAAKKNTVKRFLHISTDEVYGSLRAGSANEKYPLDPSSPYSASKAAADLLVLSYWKTYQLPVVITRSSNNYGPNQFPEKVIPLFITNLIEGKKVPLYGTGKNKRDWIYVEDNCAGVERVFDKGKEGEIYNIGAGHELNNLDLTNTILKKMNAGKESIKYVGDRLGHDFRYSVNISKIKKLGFRLETPFEDGIQKTIHWYRENASWWQPLKRDKFTLKS